MAAGPGETGFTIVGFHFCGAYLRNKVRKYGLRHCDNNINEEKIREIRANNRLLEENKIHNF